MDEKLTPTEFFEGLGTYSQLVILEFVMHALRHSLASACDIFIDMDVPDNEIARLAGELERFAKG